VFHKSKSTYASRGDDVSHSVCVSLLTSHRELLDGFRTYLVLVFRNCIFVLYDEYGDSGVERLIGQNETGRSVNLLVINTFGAGVAQAV
jgi:hypothetical protein